MHIPNSMLQGPVCPVTAVLSAAGVAIASYWAVKTKNKPTAARFAAITALIFAGQMMNFPVQDGTSGHLLGGVLASALLGVPFGILSMAIVLTIQCLVFSDGGLFVLGANVLNMALIGAGLGGALAAYLKSGTEGRSVSYFAGLGAIAWLSVMFAALACSIELAVSGTIAFSKVIPAMLGTHALIGIGEAFITVAACYAFAERGETASPRWSAAVPAAAAVIIAGMLSPFASGFPDGLEWVAEKYRFLHESAPAFVSPMPDYALPVISNEAISTAAAGIIGVAVTFLIAWSVARVLAPARNI